MPAVLVLLGYLAGSIPFGVLVTRWARGVDVREQGSGNIGATNVARVAGKKLGVLVLVLDALKGTLPVVLALRLLPESPRAHVAVALAAFLGHCYPVWLKFQGRQGRGHRAGCAHRPGAAGRRWRGRWCTGWCWRSPG